MGESLEECLLERALLRAKTAILSLAKRVSCCVRRMAFVRLLRVLLSSGLRASISASVSTQHPFHSTGHCSLSSMTHCTPCCQSGVLNGRNGEARHWTVGAGLESSLAQCACHMQEPQQVPRAHLQLVTIIGLLHTISLSDQDGFMLRGTLPRHDNLP